MCNLYDVGRPRGGHSNSDWEKAILETLEASESALRKRHGIRKTDPGLVLIERNGKPESRIMRWGFQREFNPAINNARSDKLDGMWKTAWENRRRCLIPVETFYEWSGPAGQKQTFAFQSSHPENILWAGGVWEERDGEEAYSMLTTSASEQVSAIHHRMPVLLAPPDFGAFLGESHPTRLLTPCSVSLEIFRCENPLKNPTGHEGPVKEDFLPGFE
ncbi:MAG: SOS response-associated peptidase family protein [Verrucomicrobiales bacterium]|nr:SOS response-associated peptidase family protein [Verrucomicrobiales bacterium]